MSVKEKAWHNLGQIIEDYPTSAEAIINAGLNYTVEKRPLFTYDSENSKGESDLIIPEIEVPKYYATVRTDTDEVLGVVGKDYNVIQNIEAFSFFDAIVGGKDGILYETAGALGKGERIFITAKLPGYIRVGRNDLIEQYIFLTTSHDGLGSITAAFSPVRIVCANTLNAAMKNCSNSVKIRHTTNAQERLKQAHNLMGLTNHLATELEEIFNHWARVRIMDCAVKKLVQMAMKPSQEVLQIIRNDKERQFSTTFNNIIDNVMEYALSSPTQQELTTKGTLFGAYNAVTGYFQNVRNYKDEEIKFKSINMNGLAWQSAQAAFDLCTSFARRGNSMFRG
jgi:phage/plasmid-like protein (TIGR03299 family)